MKYLVAWVKWDRSLPTWRPIYKFARCTTEAKANRLKASLLKQRRFIDVYVTEIL